MHLRLGKDTNGNKTLKVSELSGKGFSIQTLGNLPETHRMVTMDSYNRLVSEDELRTHVKKYGTDRQKELLGYC